MKLKTYQAKISLKSGGSSLLVSIQARNPHDAKKLLEAQYAGQIKSWAQSPREVR